MLEAYNSLIQQNPSFSVMCATKRAMIIIYNETSVDVASNKNSYLWLRMAYLFVVAHIEFPTK